MAAAIARMRWATRMGHSLEGPPAVGFEVELAFEGVGRLDHLADRLEQRLAVARELVFTGRPQQDDPAGGQVSFGNATGEALAGDQDQAGPGGGQLGLDVEHGGQRLALADLRVGQRPQDRHPGSRAPRAWSRRSRRRRTRSRCRRPDPGSLA